MAGNWRNWRRWVLRPGSLALPLLSWVVLVAAATLFPFDFGEGMRGRRVLVLNVRDVTHVPDVLLNVLLFVPLGVLLRQSCRATAWRAPSIDLLAATSALALSLTLEFCQQFLPSRDSSVADVLSNTAGAVLGGRLPGAWWPRAAAQITGLRLTASRALGCRVLAGSSVAVLLASGALQCGTRLSNWDESYRLAIGNEHTGDRPWQGQVLNVQLSDASVPGRVMQDFAAEDTKGLRNGNLAAFDFSTGAGTGGAAAGFPTLVWVGKEGVRTGGGVEVSEHGWLRSAEAPESIARGVRAGNEFTLRTVCQSGAADQQGPARVVSYSIDTMHRNFMLGQEGPDMVFRLRTPNMGLNGTRIRLVFPGVFSTPEVRDILVTYAGSTLSVAVAGTRTVSSLEFSPGVSLAGFYLAPQPQHFTRFKMVYCGFALLLPLGLLAWLTRSASRYFAIGSAWVLTFAFALEATLAFASPRPFDWANLGLTLVIGCSVLLLLGAALGLSAIPNGGRSGRLGALAAEPGGRSAIPPEGVDL